SYGADVTGVCSTRNLDLVRSLGANQVIDYTKEDFTRGAQRYDLILDNVGNHSLLECRRALTPRGKYVLIGGGGVNDGRWVGPVVAALALNRGFRRRNPGNRPYRWGYYFGLMSIVFGLLLGMMLESGAIAVLACGVVYAVLAWFFARRRRWAWVTLTILSFN